MKLFLAVLAAGAGFLVPALGQDIHHHEGMSEAVDKFYSTWQRPDDQKLSCCNKADCYPAEKIRYDKNRNLFFWHREKQDWVLVPPEKIEQNRDSPDGHNHVCANPDGFVYCFSYGGGT